MELVDDVIALQSQVKTLENQVKVLQQAQKSASTAKPVPAPVIDVTAIRQQLRSEFATQINQLQTEVDQLKASKAQASTPTPQPIKLGINPVYVALGMVGIGLLVLFLIWLNKPTAATTQTNSSPSSQVTSAKSQLTASAKPTKSQKGTPKKSPKESPVKKVQLLNEAEVDQAINDLEAQGYGGNNPN